MRETTALGAAIAAGLAVGLWKNFTELRDINRAGGAVFEPQVTKKESAESFANWEKAVRMCKGWVGKNAPQPDNQAPATDQKLQNSLEESLVVKDGVIDITAPKTAVKGRDLPPHKGGPIFSVSKDLDGADEDDLLLELRRIEVLQRLKRLRRVKGGCACL